MKKVLLVLSIMFLTLNLSAQSWGNSGRSSSESTNLNGYLNFGMSAIQDTSDFSLVDLDAKGALLVGKIGLELGVYRQSDALDLGDATATDPWAQDYIYGCGCTSFQSSSNNKDRFTYLRYQHYGLVVAPVVKDGAMFRMVFGLGNFNLNYPVADSTSDLGYRDVSIVKNQWTYHFGLNVAKRFDNNSIWFLDGFAFQDTKLEPFNKVFPVVKTGWMIPPKIWGSSQRTIFLGFGAYYRDHVWSGDEIGVHFLVNFGIAQGSLRGFVGAANNEVRGMRLEYGFTFTLNSLMSGFYDPL